MDEPTDDEIERWVAEGMAEDDPPELDDHWLPHWYRAEER